MIITGFNTKSRNIVCNSGSILVNVWVSCPAFVAVVVVDVGNITDLV